MRKRCFKCGRVKDLSEFYKHPQMADGHLGKCKLCTKKDVKRRYDSPAGRKKIVEYEKKREQTDARKAKKKLYQRSRRSKHPGKARCRIAVANAIRDGRLKKLPCEVCGKKAQAHHPDYRRPLFVKWLCFKHHRELEHGQITTETKLTSQ